MSIVATANGIDSFVVFAKQAGIGVKAPAGSGMTMRRSEATFQTEADSYSSNEIRTSQQQNDSRLGNFRSGGSIKCPLSANSFTAFLAAALRKAFAAAPGTITASTAIAATVNGFSRASGSFITDGFKSGTIIRAAGYTAPATANNGKNLVVLAVAALTMTCVALNGSALVAKAAGDSVTITGMGKYSFVPQTGHTKDFFTFEIADPEIALYRTFIDQLVDTVGVDVQPNGMTEFNATFKGLNEDEPTSVAYFTTPAAQTTTRNFSGATALLVVNGVASVACTGMKYTLNGSVKQDPVIGSKFVGAVSRGKVIGSGTFTVFLQDDTYLNYFRKENEISGAYIMGENEEPDCNAMATGFPRIKLKTANVSDGEINRVVTCDFDLLENADVAAGLVASTIFVQDTTL